MVVSCAAFGCTNRAKKGSNVSFHNFPEDPLLFEKWIINMRRKNFYPTKYSKLCSQHFKREDFVYNFGKKTIKSSAVPSIFNFSACLKEKHKERSKLIPKVVNEEIISQQVIPEIIPVTEDYVQPGTSSQAEPSVVPLTLIKNNRIKRKRQVYFGDFTSDDIEDPKKFKFMWSAAKKTISRQKKTITFLRTKIHRLQKRVKTLDDLITHLKSSSKISSNCHLLLKESIPASQKQILLRELKLSTNRKYPTELRAFALTLHFYSNAAYNYVRKTFNNCLPHPNTLRKWYSKVDGSPGYTAESLNALKMKANEMKKEGKILTCSLIVDEMSIRQHVQWNGHKNMGYVDLGWDIDSDTLPLAKQVLSFIVVGVNCQWKIPVAYFLIDSLSGEERANLINGCLIMMNKVQVKIISLTFDGAPANLAMCSVLGADLYSSTPKSYFLHPETKEEVFIFLDPCHVIKLIRNALSDWKMFLNCKGDQIKWQFFENLVSLQEAKELHLATKITSRHINYSNEKMKVKLAVQLFSSSVADALDYCCEDLKLEQFKHSFATSDFCRIIDKLFDILNTRNSLSKNPYKKPLTKFNFDFIRNLFQDAKKYIAHLTDCNGERLIFSRRKAGFLGLIINMTSVEMIIEKYVVEKRYLSYLLTYKLSQDHIETFFCAIRAKGGFNNNPTAAQFESAYKRLIVHAEIVSKTSANCLPQDDTYILTVSSSSEKQIATNIDSLITEESFDYSDVIISNNSDLYTSDVIGYICGFIVRKLKKQVVCKECLFSLEDMVSYSKLIERKDRGGLVKPSVHVINICKIADHVFRKTSSFSGNVLLKLKLEAKKLINFNKIFPDLSDHILDQEPLNNHLLQLVNLILDHCFKIRLHHRNTTVSEIKNRVRHQFTKLILFKHQ